MTEPPWTMLAELRWYWGGAYVNRADRANRRRAKRRDGQGSWITAPDPQTLVELIRADYQRDPVSRDGKAI